VKPSNVTCTLEFGGYSDVGRRAHNEDAWLIDAELGLSVVADGVGGRQAGEVASHLTCEVLRREVAAGSDLGEAIRTANREVAAKAAGEQGSPGMASTVVAALLQQEHYDIAWVGDSRAYFWDGKLSLLTRDHSYVEAQLAAGRISAEEARTHPRRNVILQAVGLHEDGALIVGRNAGRLGPGTRLLLCTDGVSDPLDNEQLSQLLMRGGDTTDACLRIVKLALQCQGEDNSTAVLVGCSGETQSSTPAEEPRETVWVFNPETGTYDGAPDSTPQRGDMADPLEQSQVLRPTEIANDAAKARGEPAAANKKRRFFWLGLLLAALALAATVFLR